MKIQLKKKTLRKLQLTCHPRFEQKPSSRFLDLTKNPKISVRRLAERQRLRHHHSLSHSQIKRYVAETRNYPGPSGLALLCELAMRLDSFLFQVGFAVSIRSARQLIRHGHTFVNGRRVALPGYRCRQGDLISIAPKMESRRVVSRYLLSTRARRAASNHSGPEASQRYTDMTSMSGYARVCPRNLKILVLRDIKPRELLLKVDPMLVLESFA